jgi:hypothetical protein
MEYLRLLPVRRHRGDRLQPGYSVKAPVAVHPHVLSKAMILRKIQSATNPVPRV